MPARNAIVPAPPPEARRLDVEEHELRRPLRCMAATRGSNSATGAVAAIAQSVMRRRPCDRHGSHVRSMTRHARRRRGDACHVPPSVSASHAPDGVDAPALADSKLRQIRRHQFALTPVVLLFGSGDPAGRCPESLDARSRMSGRLDPRRREPREQMRGDGLRQWTGRAFGPDTRWTSRLTWAAADQLAGA